MLFALKPFSNGLHVSFLFMTIRGRERKKGIHCTREFCFCFHSSYFPVCVCVVWGRRVLFPRHTIFRMKCDRIVFCITKVLANNFESEKAWAPKKNLCTEKEISRIDDQKQKRTIIWEILYCLLSVRLHEMFTAAHNTKFYRRSKYTKKRQLVFLFTFFFRRRFVRSQYHIIRGCVYMCAIYQFSVQVESVLNDSWYKTKMHWMHLW